MVYSRLRNRLRQGSRHRSAAALVPAMAPLVLILAVGCASYQPVLEQNTLAPEVEVEQLDGFTLLDPPGSGHDTGLVFYPGGLVEPEAYLRAMSLVADAGHPVVIVHMPSNLAVFAPFKGAEFPELDTAADRWAIAGHSLGGAMAARAVNQGEYPYAGLILIAAFPAADDDLSETGYPVLSIYGNRDLVATVEEIESSKELLPESARFVEIKGGNHAQFGSYGDQSGDGEASISREQQQRIAADAIIQFLQER